MGEDLPIEELYVRVGRELQQVQINEPLTAEDRQVIADKWDGLYGLLETHGLAQFPVEGPIPQRYVLATEAALAAHCAAAFQTTYTPALDVMREFNNAVAPDYRHAPTPFEDF